MLASHILHSQGSLQALSKLYLCFCLSLSLSSPPPYTDIHHTYVIYMYLSIAFKYLLLFFPGDSHHIPLNTLKIFFAYFYVVPQMMEGTATAELVLLPTHFLILTHSP